MAFPETEERSRLQTPGWVKPRPLLGIVTQPRAVGVTAPRWIASILSPKQRIEALHGSLQPLEGVWSEGSLCQFYLSGTKARLSRRASLSQNVVIFFADSIITQKKAKQDCLEPSHPWRMCRAHRNSGCGGLCLALLDHHGYLAGPSVFHSFHC